MLNFRRLKQSPSFIPIVCGVVAVLSVGSWAAGSLVATTTFKPAANSTRQLAEVSTSPTAEAPSPTAAPAPTTPAPAKPAPAAAAPAPAPTAACTKPAFVTSDKNGMWNTAGYFVHNNMWNDEETLGPETLSACSYKNWYVVSNQTNHAGAVKTYPNVHKDYDDQPINSFKTITSTFAATSPHVGIYNVAYDIWLNGIADNGSTEVMIWTENFNQVPAGRKVGTASFGGRNYSVWKESDNKYIAFVPTTAMTSGNLDLLAMFRYLIGQGWLPAGSTVGQIDYGVEIVSTNGKPATFTFTDFSITSN